MNELSIADLMDSEDCLREFWRGRDSKILGYSSSTCRSSLLLSPAVEPLIAIALVVVEAAAASIQALTRAKLPI